MKSIIYFIFFISSFLQAQVIVSKDATYINNTTLTTPKAILDVQATDQGVMLPKVNLLILQPTNISEYPPEGTIVYNISNAGNPNSKGYYIFKNNKWSKLLNSDTVLSNIAFSKIYTASTFVPNGTSTSAVISYDELNDINYFPNNSSMITDGQFAVGAPSTGWTTVPSFSIPKVEIASNFNLKNKISVNGSGLVRFNNSLDGTFDLIYSVALFRQTLDASNNPTGNAYLVASKIFNLIISGTCSYDFFDTNFYEENIPSGNYTYFLGYKYVRKNRLATNNPVHGQKMGIGYSNINAGNATCNNHSDFSAQQNITLTLNLLP